MIINSISIKGIHGYLDKTVRFNEKINILVGINGSGKTTILNAIRWMLNPIELPQICITKFSDITLKITHKGVKYTLSCKRKGKLIHYTISRSGQRAQSFHPLEIPVPQMPDGLLDDPEARQMLLRHYVGMRPNTKEIKTYTFLQQLPKPYALGLERTIAKESKDNQLIAAAAIEHIKSLANLNYTKYKNNLNALNDQLRNQFMIAAFDHLYLESNRASKTLGRSELQDLRDRFNRYVAQGPSSNTAISHGLQRAATDYFDRIDSLLTQKRSQSSMLIIDIESRKLKKLIHHLEEFEQESEKLYESINSYLNTLNGFLKDSSKRLLFRPESNQLCFQVLSKHDQPLGAPRDIDLLSSGERQLVTLLTFISFSEGGTYIIDEPELSLHPKWQDGFLAAIQKVMPINTQLILATHSPAIVGQHRQYCTPLFPYND